MCFSLENCYYKIISAQEWWQYMVTTFPPISGKMCIFPVWLAFIEDTIKQVPHKMTCRRLQRFTGSCSFPFRTL